MCQNVVYWSDAQVINNCFTIRAKTLWGKDVNRPLKDSRTFAECRILMLSESRTVTCDVMRDFVRMLESPRSKISWSKVHESRIRIPKTLFLLLEWQLYVGTRKCSPIENHVNHINLRFCFPKVPRSLWNRKLLLVLIVALWSTAHARSLVFTLLSPVNKIQAISSCALFRCVYV